MAEPTDQGRHLQQQELPLASSQVPQSQQPGAEMSWSERLYLLFAIAVSIPLLYMFGPIILSAQAIARWVWKAFWQEEKDARIKSVWEAAWLYLLLYLPIAFLHAQLEAVWTWCFALLSGWTHLPLLTWVATPALYPFTPQTLLYRWLLSIPLTYLWAAIWMTTDDRGNSATVTYTRVLLPDEVAQLRAAKDAEAKKAAHKSRASTPASTQAQPKKAARQVTARKPHSTRAKQSPADEPQATTQEAGQVPKPDSLWGEVKWEQVPDNNPLKQAARQAKKKTPAATTPPTPPEPPQPSPKKDDYDWDSGDGSLSL